MSREQTIRNRPVPISPSGTTGNPRIDSHPSRSTSNGFIRTSAAGNGQFMLCWSIALEIASRFFASGEATPGAYLEQLGRYLRRMDRAELPRPLTPQEATTIRALLEHETFPGRDELLDQVPLARVVGRCGCGCATVELAVDRSPADAAVSHPIPTEATVLDEDGDGIGGMLLFASDGCLDQLEVYSYGDDSIRSLPPLDRLSIR